MMALWNQRAPREKALISIAAGLLGAALVIQLALVPALDARSRAAASVTESTNTLTRLRRLEASGAAFVQTAPATQVPDAGTRAARLALDTGLVLKPTTSSATPLQYSFETTEPTRVFKWIDEAESKLGLTVSSAEISSAGPDLVDATIVFAGAPEP